MPAGVTWGQYIKFVSAAMLSMMAGSQLVHMYYKPLEDLNIYIEHEIEAVNNIEKKANETTPNVTQSSNNEQSQIGGK